MNDGTFCANPMNEGTPCPKGYHIPFSITEDEKEIMRLAEEVRTLKGKIANAQAILAPLCYQTTPSVLAIREALYALR